MWRNSVSSLRAGAGRNTSRGEDSIVISDSDEEDNDLVSKARFTEMKVIEDSDSESSSHDEKVEMDNNGNNGNDSGTVDSEQEDLEFLNRSQAEAIVYSSESENDEKTPECKRKTDRLKRRSIYDPPPSPKHKSQEKKKFNRGVPILDSDSDSDYKSHQERNKLSLSSDNNDTKNTNVDVKLDNQVELKKGSTNNLTEDHVKEIPKKEEDNELSDNKFSLISEAMANENPTFNKSLEVDKKRQSSKQYSFTHLLEESSDLSTNYDKENVSEKSLQSSNLIDLTHHNIVKRISNIQDEIIVCSSTSTSEYEIEEEEEEVKEVKVGNADLDIAQKKKNLLLEFESCQKELDKLKKLPLTVIEQLPDKGAKVNQSKKDYNKKMISLKAQLERIEQASKPVSIAKVKPEPLKSPTVKELFITATSNDENKIKNEIKVKKEDSSNHFKEFDVHDIPNVPQTNFETNDLGKKALETLNKQQSLTNKRLEQLHNSLTSRPTEDQKEKDPDGLRISLFPHQQHALAWMKWRESQKPKGGILADDMGLGKTLTMISLILATINNKDETDSDSSSSDSNDSGDWYSHNKHKRYYGGTLVICPASLLKQWESEVKKRCKRDRLSVLVFHGNNRKVSDRKLSKYNIVVTTYQIIVREADPETGFYKMEWNRIILDEAHYIRNHKSKACIAVCGLSAKRRWALTGTPIQNKEMDLFAILKYLKCSPFDDLHVWKRWVDNRNDAGKQRLITIMKTIMLRRTKQELQAKGGLESLPDKSFEMIEVELDRDEQLVYQKILLFSQNLFAEFLAQRADKHHTRELHAGKFDRPSASGMATQFTKAQNLLLQHHSKIRQHHIESHEILVLLLRLRQMCCHPALIHKMLEVRDAELNGMDHEEINEDMLSQLQNMSIKEGEEEVDEHVANYKFDTKIATNLLTKKNPVFDDNRRSSKVRAIIQTIKEILNKDEKMVVVSQWTSFLKVIAKNLIDVEDVHYEMFTGEVAVKNRQEIVDKFNNPRSDVNILFLSLTAGGVGLNLVGANHLLLVDIHWNPQLEAQAQDRIYRFGQKKNVYIYKFLCKDTIEVKIKMLQEKKLALADHVLTGTRSVSSKLTIEDLKLLFS